MTPAAIIFVLVLSIALLRVPRRWAPLPLLMAACYMTLGQVVMIGPFHFMVIRILVAVGVVRVIIRGERPRGGMSGLDWLMVAWAMWALSVSVFHKDPYGTLVNHLGQAYNALGVFFLIRCFCQSDEDFRRLVKMTAILLIPVALEMLNEQLTGRNLFSVFGGIPEIPQFRVGRLRSQGPFHHPILAGTVGAVCMPLMIGVWRTQPFMAKAGLAACLTMVLTSASSGPVLSLLFGIFGLILWRWRHLTRQMRIAAVVGYVLLALVMKAPPYWFIARVDVIGGSTGYHRAKLIESAIAHIGEWWFAGTDYTGHWMPTVLPANPDFADMTNHYLQMGVMGGLPLMILFILTIWLGFRYVGEALRQQEASHRKRFLVWALGASLLAHTATMISVSYFDQSFLFLYLDLAMIASVRAAARSSPTGKVTPQRWRGGKCAKEQPIYLTGADPKEVSEKHGT